MIEMAFRAYDPCFSCATHCIPGQMPIILEIREANGELLQRLVRN
jgi:F420-non-reducing hydrogenase large subunit